ncbi:MAG: VIT family protein [Sandaracinobacter sp.]|jgi:VIT1/CCC1 family predicted Fe2+/Mn2+ transporter
MPRSHHPEAHAVSRTGWLRAAVLGANDGIVSTASLILGVAAAGAARGDILLAGLAGLVAGALSMAAGEYVSVSSQADAEAADLGRERRELAEQPDMEFQELVAIYVGRGLDRPTAETVATQLTAHDALGAHARDELGLTDTATARPLQAAITSALTFAVGAALPLVAVLLAPAGTILPVVALASLLSLVLLGAVGAQTGKSPVGKSILRITFWGAFAMALTALIGRLAGTAV